MSQPLGSVKHRLPKPSHSLEGVQPPAKRSASELNSQNVSRHSVTYINTAQLPHMLSASRPSSHIQQQPFPSSNTTATSHDDDVLDLAFRLHQPNNTSRRSATFKSRKPPSLKVNRRDTGRSVRLPPVPSAPAPIDVSFSQHKPLPPHVNESNLPDNALRSEQREFSQSENIALKEASVDIVEKLQKSTTQDLVDFIKKQGDDAGFLYLIPRDQSKVDINVYDLKVVHHSDIEDGQTFFTLSSQGITQIEGTSASFTPLDRFEQEYKFNQKLRQLPIFYRYRTWKAFNVWRNNVVQTRRHAHTEELCNQLFLHHNVIRPALRQIRDICLSIVQLCFVEIDPTETYTVRQFLDVQKAQSEQTTAKLHQMRNRVVEIAGHACHETVKQLGLTGEMSPLLAVH
eukprot:gene759-4049_t